MGFSIRRTIKGLNRKLIIDKLIVNKKIFMICLINIFKEPIIFLITKKIFMTNPIMFSDIRHLKDLKEIICHSKIN